MNHLLSNIKQSREENELSFVLALLDVATAIKIAVLYVYAFGFQQ